MLFISWFDGENKLTFSLVFCIRYFRMFRVRVRVSFSSSPAESDFHITANLFQAFRLLIIHWQYLMRHLHGENGKETKRCCDSMVIKKVSVNDFFSLIYWWFEWNHSFFFISSILVFFIMTTQTCNFKFIFHNCDFVNFVILYYKTL